MVGILNWNQKEDTLRCLESLQKVEGENLQVVVLDNNSSDGSADAIEKVFPSMTVLRSDVNRGCAGGRNDLILHFLHSDANYLAFLDNDVKVSPNCFSHLLRDAESSPEIGVVGIKAYYEDRPKVFWLRGGAILDPWRGRFTHSGRAEVDEGQYEQCPEVTSVPGGFTFLKRVVAEKVDRIDERYFIYYEDSDWCYRVRKAGFRVVASKKARVYHKASSSLGMESPLFYYYRTRNQLLFMWENVRRFFVPFLFYRFFYSLPKTLLRLWLTQEKKQTKAILLGLVDFFRGRFYTCPHLSLYEKKIR